MEFAWLEARHLKTSEKTFLVVGSKPTLVGRPSSDSPPDKLTVPFDSSLSRSHFFITLEGKDLRIKRCPEARRPLFFHGEAEEEFVVHPGQSFSSGQTLFRYVQEAGPEGRPVKLDPTLLTVAHEQDASRGLRALLALQPLLRRAEDPHQLIQGTLSVLGEVIPSAGDIMALEVDRTGSYKIIGHLGEAHYLPSRTLVRQCLEQNTPLCYLWSEAPAPGEVTPTLVEGVTWAVAAPIHNFVLYVLGSESSDFGGKNLSPGDLDRAVLALVADVVSGALEKVSRQQLQLEVEAERARRNLAERLCTLQQALMSSLDPEELARLFLGGLGGVLHYERAAVMFVEQGGYRVSAVAGIDNQLPLVRRPDNLRDENQAGWLQFPLQAHQQQELGYLVAGRTHEFHEDEMLLMQALAGQAAVALQNARLHAKIQQLANLDSLTGLSNRRHFMQEAARAVERSNQQNQPLSLILVDVDHFKQLNDRYGHETGDAVLREIAHRLQSNGLPGLLGRYGGEEFVLLTPLGAEKAQQLAERLRQAVEQPLSTGPQGQPLQVTISLGVSAHERGRSLEDMLRLADKALYAAKEAGRNRFVFQS